MSDIQNVTQRQGATPAELVGRVVDSVTGKETIVPIKLHSNGDGTWSLDIAATIEGDVIVGAAMNVKNVAGATINPATEDTLSSLCGVAVTPICSVTTASGEIVPATLAKQIKIKNLIINNAGASDVTVGLIITQSSAPVTIYSFLYKPGVIYQPITAPDFILCDVNTNVGIALDATVTVNYHIDYTLV